PRPGEATESLRRRLRQALALIDRAERVLPGGAATRSGLLRRARYLAALGEEDAAHRASEAAERTPIRLAADRFLDGLDLFRKEKYGEAAGPLSFVLRDQPDHYGAEYLLAVCRLRQEQFEAGREGLSRCLKQRPTFAWPR